MTQLHFVCSSLTSEHQDVHQVLPELATHLLATLNISLPKEPLQGSLWIPHPLGLGNGTLFVRASL